MTPPVQASHLILTPHKPGGGGGTLIGSGRFFWFKILNFNVFWDFQKKEYFWGYEDFVKIFWGHHKIRLYLGVISIYFRVFS